MTLGPDVGTAHITVKPSLRGWSRSMREELRREMGGSAGDALEDAVSGPGGRGAQSAGRRSGQQFAGGFDREVRTRIGRALDRLPPVEIGAATSEAEQKVRDLRVSLERLRSQRIGVDISAAGAIAQVVQLRAQLTELGNASPDVQVQADTLSAAAQLTALQAQIDAVSNRVDITADADTAAATAQLTFLGRLVDRLNGRRVRLQADGTQIDGMSRRTGFLIRLFATLGPALLPLGAVLISLAASFTATFTAAAAGIGILLAGVLGAIIPVIKAQSELEQKQKAADSAAQSYAAAQQGVAAASQGVADAERSASRSVADAARALADARRSAARAIAAAEDAVGDAQDRARDAQQALNQARAEARDKLAAYRDQLRGAALDESGAALSVTAAREALNNVLTDSSSSQLDIDQARQALAEAQFAYDQAGERGNKLRAQAKKDRAAGVSGDQSVIEARERLAEANADVADAERDLGQARADAARSVADAERNLARARSDGARSVAAAEDQLAEARQSAADAAAANAEAQADLAETMAKLSGPAAIFVAALDRAKAAWKEFIGATSGDSFALAVTALDMFSALLPNLVPLFRGAAAAVGVLLEDLAKFGKGEEGQSFLDWLTKRAPGAIISMGRSIGNLLKGFGYLVGALADSDTGFLDMTRRFSKWARNLDRNPTLKRFVAYVRRMMPVVGAFLGAIADAFVNIVTAAAPIGTFVLKALTGIARGIASIDPDVLTAIVGALLLIKGALTIATIAVAAFNLALAANPFTLIVIGVGLAVAALYVAYRKIDSFRAFVDRAFTAIKRVVVDIWNNYLKPTLVELGNTAVDLWKKHIGPAFREIGRIIANAWTNIIRPALKAMGWYIKNVLIPIVKFLWFKVVRPYFYAAANYIRFVYTKMIRPIFNAWWGYLTNVLIPVLKTLWNKVVKPLFQQIGDKISTVWNNAIKPALVAFRDFVRDTLAPAIRTGLGKIGEFFNTLKKAAAAPILFVVETVWNNGLRKVINAIPGVKDLDPVGVEGLKKFAAGGPVTGGVRGRDSVLSLLMPGEHVLTTEEVAKAGGHGVIRRMRQMIKSGRISELGNLPARSLRDARTRGDLPAFAEGGSLTATQVSRGLRFAADNIGDPYVWGGVGPDGFDCSGFMSAITNAIRGVNPYSRLGATASFPWSGFKPGPGQFTIGSTPNYAGSGVGHMAGTLAGVNVESRGGQGVLFGSSARGYNDPGFSTVYHLGSSDTTGSWGGDTTLQGMGNAADALKAKFAGALKAIASFLKNAPGFASKISSMGPWGKLARTGLHGIGDDAADFINDKVPGSPMRNVFDQGGLARGTGLMFKKTIRPERVLSPEQTAIYERQVASLEGWGQSMRSLEQITNGTRGGEQTFLMRRFKIEDWEKGFATMELIAVDAAHAVVDNQSGHAQRISALTASGYDGMAG